MTAQVDLKPGSPTWLRLVTGSKIAPILGVSPYSDQYSMWHAMAGNLPPQEVTEAMRRGTFHEEGVLSEFFHRHPEVGRIADSGRTVQVDKWMAVTPDALAWGPGGEDELVYAEAKTTADWDEWGEPGTDEIPEHYLAQVIVTAHCVKADQIFVPVVGPFWDYREYVVSPDPVLARALMARCREFWDTVQSGAEPELSQTLASYTTWQKVGKPGDDGDVEIPPALAREYLECRVAEKRQPEVRAEIVNHLIEADAKRAVCQGYRIAQRQNTKSGVALVVARKAPSPTVIQIESEAA